MYTGRHRRKSHGGLPQGSTINAGASLHFYYQWNNRETVDEWPDSSQNSNPAQQSSSDNQPAAVVGGGLDFEDSDDAANASMMDFTSITVPGANDFIMFIVWHPETASSGAYLSDSTSEVFQLTTQNRNLFKTSTGSNNITHGSSPWSIPLDRKSVFILHRTNTSTGNLMVYKNGLIFNPTLNDPTTFDLQNLGSKNDSSNWFDGIIYDVGIISGDAAKKANANETFNRDLITDYLCAKHGIERLG